MWFWSNRPFREGSVLWGLVGTKKRKLKDEREGKMVMENSPRISTYFTATKMVIESPEETEEKGVKISLMPISEALSKLQVLVDVGKSKKEKWTRVPKWQKVS